MPLPPPPAAAFTSTGKPTSSGTVSAPWCGHDGTTGTPASTASVRAASLRPICSITSADGPTSVSPAFSTARANSARSERKP